MTATRPLNATAGSLLGFLHEGPQSGWDLAVTAREMIGDFWSLTQSQIYRELSAMAAAGLITAGDSGPRERRPYHLTAAGQAAFIAWLDQEPANEQIRYPLLLTLAFARHLPARRLAQFLAHHRAEHAARLEVYHRTATEAAAAGATTLDLITLDFGLRYEQGVLAWFDHLPADLTG